MYKKCDNIVEHFAPNRKFLLLEFIEKQAIKTAENIKRIKKYLQKFGESKTETENTTLK